MFVYCGSAPFRYFITSPFDPYDDNQAMEVSEAEFFDLVGFNRDLVPMRYDKNNINRQNFYSEDAVGREFPVAFRIRGKNSSPHKVKEDW